jgi:hypothetical protein
MVPLNFPFWKLRQRGDAINEIQTWFDDNFKKMRDPSAEETDAVRDRTVLTFLGPSGIGKTRIFHQVPRLMIPAGRKKGYTVLPILITLNGSNGPPQPKQSQSVNSQLAWRFLHAYLSPSDGFPEFYER